MSSTSSAKRCASRRRPISRNPARRYARIARSFAANPNSITLWSPSPVNAYSSQDVPDDDFELARRLYERPEAEADVVSVDDLRLEPLG